MDRALLDLIVKISSKTVSRPEATRSHYKTTVLETRGTYSKPPEVELFIKKKIPKVQDYVRLGLSTTLF